MTTDKSRADALTYEQVEALAVKHQFDMSTFDFTDSNSLVDLVNDAIRSFRPVEQHEAAPALSRQDIFDKFSFLEGLVSQSTYVSIAETAVSIYEHASKAAQPEPPAADERAVQIAHDLRCTGVAGTKAGDLLHNAAAMIEELAARASSPNAAGAEGAKSVATVRVTNGGYGMELSTHVAYALPEGHHELYARSAAQAAEPVGIVHRPALNGADFSVEWFASPAAGAKLYAAPPHHAPASAPVGLTDADIESMANACGLHGVRQAVVKCVRALLATQQPEPRDAIARSKRILGLVDEYHENPTRDTRAALRIALMDEFQPEPRGEVTDCGCATNEACKMKTDGSCWRAD
ncbi:hypothetical protein [Burkholderia cenocepacia]|nr:hypothetical protein [Burkholderia cenocepacia]MBR8248638.1 hypothetical protein [Burkholderia cenocepacia]MBR8288812.1 hypothetical protein [Burkholderia cenocepacia]MBR8498564.1 hypothetical protein [Burkholderia cenocepacia]ONQ73842.1 hypothetical protein A8E05_20010 [Burkholderia cenocepacia]ONQ93911.1 hypothetical protein A8E04_25655 [Burkholderia cenocepacia]